ncbi:MAG TPA: fatty acid desaturase [Aquabacterium sp.]|nr:fatty acid desaturase [Aquabacterium sp.]
MTPQQYKSLRKQLAQQGLFQANNGFGVLVVALESAFFFGGLLLLSHLTPWSWPFVLTQILLGSSIFRFFVLMHDCGHYSLFKTRKLNNLFGLWTSVFCVTPLLAWREIHFGHHKWVGIKDRDPTAAGLITFEEKQRHSRPTVALLRLIWICRLPLPAILFTVNVLWGYPARLLKQGQTKQALLTIGSGLIALTPHALAIGYWGGLAYATYYLPVLLASFVWYESINLTHHAGLYKFSAHQHPEPLALYEQQTVSRSCHMPTWLSTLLCYHFNLHAEHHLFPVIPWHHLPAVRQALQEVEVSNYIDVPFPGFNNALRRADPVGILLNQLPPSLQDMQKPLLRSSQGLAWQANSDS